MQVKYNANVSKSIASGGFKPHQWLTNVSVAHFQRAEDFVAPNVFPVVPVELSSGRYRIFKQEDLARDNMQRKPEFGHVDPAVISTDYDEYNCQVDQIIVGRDLIQGTNESRMNLPGASDPKIGMARTVAEQSLLHLDNKFAESYFCEGAWTQEYTGDTKNSPDEKKFIKFTDANSEPISFFHSLCTTYLRQNRRRFNVMLCGVEAFDALINHPDILDRIKMGGSTQNPAIANEQVLASLFGLERVFQVGSTINKAGLGEEMKMEFVCDPKAILLAYVNNRPSIDEPTAGYIFTWDPLGNGNPMNITTYPGHPADHSEFVEGLCSYSMHKVCDAMGVFLKECCDD